MENKFDRKKNKYIYNLHWANFLVLNGGIVTGIGISKKTGSPYIAFDYDSVQDAYNKYKDQEQK